MPDEIQIDDLSPEVLEKMTDLQPIWEAICRDLGINPRLVCVYFLEVWEVKFDFEGDFGYFDGQGAARWTDDGGLPEVAVVFPYTEGKDGFRLDMVELKNTCYHELVHLLLPDEIEEEVAKLADILNLRQEGWHYWCSFLQERAIARGLGPVPPEQVGVPL